MRKTLFIIACALTLSTSIFAKEQIPLTVNGEDDDMPIGHDRPKAPKQPPTVFIEDYTLSFVAGHPDYVLNIKDEDGDVVYTTYVYSAQTQVALPSSLSGSYEVELLMGNWKFTGYITYHKS